MVIVSIVGGTGNQLFQYAFAKVIEQKAGVAVRLLDETKSPVYSRQWELHNFNISLSSTSLPKRKKMALLNRFLCRIAGKSARKPFIVMKGDAPLARDYAILNRSRSSDFFLPAYQNQATHLFEFIDRLDPSQDYILRGYWQYAALANSIESLLRKDLSFTNTPTSSTNRTLEQIRMADDPVAIHMRTSWHSDIIARPTVHPQRTLAISYYQKAIEIMKGRLSSARFFVFADNIQRASALLAGLDLSHEAFYYVDSSGRSAWEDMFLIHHCKHFVLSNSSFSWWGCWLAANKTGITIMPANWQGYNLGCLIGDGLEMAKGTIRL